MIAILYFPFYERDSIVKILYCYSIDVLEISGREGLMMTSKVLFKDVLLLKERLKDLLPIETLTQVFNPNLF